MAERGGDGSVRLGDGRTLEYWDGGDPDGRPVLFHPGTPVTRRLGRWAHAAAGDAGIRLVTINRPGYGGSTPVPPSSGLRAIGRDTAELAGLLEMAQFAVMGSSGGGPYAVATAIAAGPGCRALGLIGAVGPWRELEPADYAIEDRACLAMLDAGDAAGAHECLAADVRSHHADLTPEAAAAEILGEEDSAVTRDNGYRALWVENMADVQANPIGYIFDNLAWGGRWDIDPRDVAIPAYMLYGGNDAHCAADRHGTWYAERLVEPELVVLPDAGHMEVIDGHWPEALAGIRRAWERARPGP